MDWIESEAELDGLWNNNFSGNMPADLIALDGDLYTDLTLKEDYIIYSVGISEGVTLTIQPGTILLAAAMYEGSIEIAGKLIAEGTEEEPIVFTSVRDPEYGGSGITGPEDGWEGRWL